MGRCGCGTGTCSCVVRGQPPIAVTGNGSVQQGYVVSIEHNGRTGCEAIVACLSEALGAGLRYDQGSGRLMIRLSTDDGQVARLGSDEGLLVTNGTGPTPPTCMQGLASLPAAPGVVGAQMLGGLLGPYSSPHQLDWCLEQNIDVIAFRACTTSDDVGVVCEYGDHKATTLRTSIYISQDYRQISSSLVTTLTNYAGDENDPNPYWPEEDVLVRTDRRGGWYGSLAARYRQPLVGNFLARIDGKGVALINCSPDASAAYGEDTALIGPVRAVLRYCAQAWALIGVQSLTNAATILAKGIQACLLPGRPPKWNTTTLPYPVASVTGAGVQWIVLSDRYADSVHLAYKNAGVNVLMETSSRHSARARVTALGVRGAMAYDPLYYRGPLADGWPYGYRAESDPWEHRQQATGQLTYRTDQMDVLNTSGTIRGRYEAAEQGLVLPAGWGGGLGRPSVLCGWECPMTNPTSYKIEWDMKWNSLATVSAARAKMGLLVGAATDSDPYDWPQNDAVQNPLGLPEGQKTLYRVYQRQNGELGIAKWSSQTAAVTYLATATSPALAADVWNSYTLVVTPDKLTFTRTVSNGTKYTVTASDSQYRGGYFWIEKEEGTNGDTPNPFEGKFRNVVYTG